MQQDEVKTMKEELIQEVKHSVVGIQRESLTYGMKGLCLRQSRFEIALNSPQPVLQIGDHNHGVGARVDEILCQNRLLCSSSNTQQAAAGIPSPILQTGYNT